MSTFFRREVIHKDRLSGEISLIQPAIFSHLAIFLCLIVTISIIFLSIGHYTKKIKVKGILQPNTGLIRLKSPKAGIVSELLVKEGSYVLKGQPLIRIKSEHHGIGDFELNQYLINEKKQELIISKQEAKQKLAKYNLQINSLNANKSILKARLTQLKINRDLYEKRLILSIDIVKQISQLAGTGYVSNLELKKQQDNLLVLEQQKYSIESEKSEINRQLEQIDSQLLQLPLVYKMEENQIKTKNALLQSEIEIIKQKKTGELRASSNGVITGLLTKLGKFVDIRQNLMSLIPDKSYLRAIIYIPTSSLGFTEIGQKVNIRYHAFPYQRYGIFTGKVIEISSNVILPSETDIPGIIKTPSYRAVIELNDQFITAYGKNISLRTGMELDADIITDKRSLIRWLFDPIFSLRGQL